MSPVRYGATAWKQQVTKHNICSPVVMLQMQVFWDVTLSGL